MVLIILISTIESQISSSSSSELIHPFHNNFIYSRNQTLRMMCVFIKTFCNYKRQSILSIDTILTTTNLGGRLRATMEARLLSVAMP